MVAGVCATDGSRMVRKPFNENGIGEFIGIDHNESEIFFHERRFSKHRDVSFGLDAVRERDNLRMKMGNVGVIFHAARSSGAQPASGGTSYFEGANGDRRV